ncbi:DUF7716 domain-containing protein [Xenorhabdus szentirmaii]|uniref:DUF7716 domain-containing protein n=2 Tax=Xenorhabdus szentirmaii TaxID=290112 RepID=W1IXA2_9GAMM|nr:MULTISPECIES: hypothetical protein [Xenorhabdus]MBD2802108.1 hypothetical protein [Xenorhabdus sp. M]PHM35036.1 hypothetical protein Xsze_01486 [Xenorhabdus szentirmaii DSM 16338]PHM43830.1 hypothetical protein Xszus_03637 [Xenorhabdus szentirmaii]CDL82251.1 conserved hypothetical protein [Xenorhabdus szentirmaii DSM 16338]
MKTIKGFDGLLVIYKELEDAMGFFVDPDFKNEINCINDATYYLSETRDEDFDMEEMEDEYKTWLDYQTFRAIIDNKLEHHPNATRDELLEAVVYYLEEDDFLD